MVIDRDISRHVRTGLSSRLSWISTMYAHLQPALPLCTAVTSTSSVGWWWQHECLELALELWSIDPVSRLSHTCWMAATCLWCIPARSIPMAWFSVIVKFSNWPGFCTLMVLNTFPFLNFTRYPCNTSVCWWPHSDTNPLCIETRSCGRKLWTLVHKCTTNGHHFK